MKVNQKNNAKLTPLAFISLRVGKIHFDMPGTTVNVGANPVRDGAVADVVGGIVTTSTQAQAASPAIPAMVRLL